MGSFYQWKVSDEPVPKCDWVGLNTRGYIMASEGPDDLNLLPEQITLTPELVQASELFWATNPEPSSTGWNIEIEPEFYWIEEVEPEFYWQEEVEPDFYYGLQKETLFYWEISTEPLFYYTDEVAPVDQGEWGEFYIGPPRFYVLSEPITSFYWVVNNFDC